MKFFFQIGKGKYEPVFGIIMIFKYTRFISIVSKPVKVVVLVVVIVIAFVKKSKVQKMLVPKKSRSTIF